MEINNQNNQQQDDYLPCDFYNGESLSEDGIYNFVANGKFYFSFIENEKVILRSEGYLSEPGRESGIASILKNKENESQYKILKLDDGSWVIALDALNHQEIARSCGFATEAEARELLPAARTKARESLILNASAVANQNNTAIAEDDYLICGEYEERVNSTSAVHKDFISFQHPATNKFYFAWLSGDNKIILRSEGYTSSAARDNGLASVVTFKEIKGRYKIEEKRGLYYLVLTAGNQKEIGRSCPKKSEAAAWELINPIIASPIASASILNGTITKSSDKEDDYLLCTEYHGHPVTDKQNNIALFTYGEGEYYFAVYNTDGSVKLRSEGFSTIADRDRELNAVIAHINNPLNYSKIEKAGYEIKILKDETGREIGRTCPKKIFVAAAPVIAPVIPAKGFSWWWLLLLLIPLLIWWKSCNKPAMETPSVIESPATTDTPAVNATAVVKDTDGDGIKDDVDACPNLAGIPGNAGCPEMILYYKRAEADLDAADKADLDKVAVFLQNNSNLHILIEGHTSTLGDDIYNQKLSEQRANNSLQYLVSKGIDAGRLKAAGYGEQFPVGDNNTEEGRAKSRRTIIKVDK